MQDLNDKLTVLRSEDGVVFDDESMSAFSFFKSTFQVTDELYVGFRKPITSMFVGVTVGSSDDSEVSAQYWNGAWVDLPLHDETDALSASGFVRWIQPTDQVANTVNGKSLFWIKLSLLLDTPVTIQGVGPLLCSEDDLRGIDYSLDETPTNILKAMVAARTLICKEMQVSPWDILNIPDVTDAATFLSLSNIYYNQSDREDDHYKTLGDDYYTRYSNLKDKLGITIDANDNGVADESEKTKPSVVYLER